MSKTDEAGSGARRSKRPKKNSSPGRYGPEPTPPLKLLVADPPWPFRDGLPGGGRGARKHYRLLSLDEIRAFPLPAVDENSTLALWRVSSMVEEAYSVVRAWGFIPKSELVWCKLQACVPCRGSGRLKPDSIAVCKSCRGEGHHEAFGMGHYGRGAHETVIIATRGSGAKRLSAGERTTFYAPMPVWPNGKPIHSAKPSEFYAKISRMFEGPRGELFARVPRLNWWAAGDELGLLTHPESHENERPSFGADVLEPSSLEIGRALP